MRTATTPQQKHYQKRVMAMRESGKLLVKPVWDDNDFTQARALWNMCCDYNLTDVEWRLRARMGMAPRRDAGTVLTHGGKAMTTRARQDFNLLFKGV